MSSTAVERAALMERLSLRLGVVGLIPLLLLLVVVVMTLVEPRFYALPNLFNILRNTSFLAIMACGQMLVMTVGGMDLSVGATAALTSVVAAKVMSSATETYGVRPGAAIALGIVASVGSAAAIGLLNGLCSALLRVPALIVTLGTLSIASGITFMMTSGIPVYGLPQPFITDFGRALWWGVPAPAYVAIAVVGAVWLMRRRTPQLAHRWTFAAGLLCAIFLAAFDPLHPLHYLHPYYHDLADARRAIGCVPKDATFATYDEWFSAVAAQRPGATIDRTDGMQYLVYADDFPSAAYQQRLRPAVAAQVGAGRYRVVCRFGEVAVYRAAGSP